MGRPEARARLTPRLKPGACAALPVSVLHSLWDVTALVPAFAVALPFGIVPVPALVIGGVGLWALHRRLVESRRPPALSAGWW